MLFGNKTKQVESAIDHKKADKLIALAKDKDEAVALAAANGVPLCRTCRKGAALACRHIALRLCGIKQPLLDL